MDSRDTLDQHLRRGNLDGLEFLDIVPIPMHGDRSLRLRTLEEALEDFVADNGAVSYLIQIKARQAKPVQAGTLAKAPAAAAAGPAVHNAPAPHTGPGIHAAPAAHTGSAAAAGPASPHRPSAATASPVTGDNIYQGDGKLNIPYLAQNAELLLAAHEYTLARNIYRAIAASGERTGLALFGVARCDEAEGRLEDARVHFEESIAYHPTLESFHRLGAVLMILKKDGLAGETFERALNLKDLDNRTRFELHKASGNCFTRARASAQAERQYKFALELDPSADDIRSNLGALYLQSQNVGEAQRFFEDSLASNPRNARALSGLASCYLAGGDKRRAHDTFARALEIELNNPTAIYHLVKCAYEIRSYATAARVVEDYVQVAPINVSLMYSLAGLQFHLGRTKDARATALQTLGLNAEHGGARELLKLIERSVS